MYYIYYGKLRLSSSHCSSFMLHTLLQFVKFCDILLTVLESVKALLVLLTVTHSNLYHVVGGTGENALSMTLKLNGDMRAQVCTLKLDTIFEGFFY